MEPKDYLSIGISGLAFVVSTGAAIFALESKKHDDERSNRAMLTDTVSKIILARGEQAKLSTGMPVNQALISAYFTQINALARLAVYTADKIPQLAADVDYSVVADAFGATSDPEQARKYFNLAIERSKGTNSEIRNRSSFAQFHFMFGDVRNGRDQYTKALALISPNDDFGKWTEGMTHQMWAVSERARGELSRKG